MTADGVNFLENWITDNVPVHPRTVEARKLGEQLRSDAATAGFTLEDLELDEASVEKYILDAMLLFDEPGTPGD